MHVAAHTFDATTGYGRWARSVVAAFESFGAKVMISAGCQDIPDDLKHLQQPRPKIVDVSVYPPPTKIPAKIQFTTFEGTEFPEGSQELRKRDLVIVPCEQNKQACTKFGVKHVHVIPPAIQTHYCPLTNFGQFTFLHIGADNSIPERKRTKQVISAFLQAFPREENVRLLIKKDPVDAYLTCFDRRISQVHTKLASMDSFYRAAHVGVFPSGLEGWGFCQADLMGIGRPIIAPFFGGPADYCNDVNAYGLVFQQVKVPKKFYKNKGFCAAVKTENLARVMRFCYENPDDVILKGIHAYRTMLGYSFSRMTAALRDIL